MTYSMTEEEKVDLLKQVTS